MAQGWSYTGNDTRKEPQSRRVRSPALHSGLPTHSCLSLHILPRSPHPRTLWCHPQTPHISVLSTELSREADGCSLKTAPLLGCFLWAPRSWEDWTLASPSRLEGPSALLLFHAHNPIFAQEDAFPPHAGRWPPPRLTFPLPANPGVLTALMSSSYLAGILAVTDWWSHAVSHTVAADGLQGLCGTFTRGMANHPDTVLRLMLTAHRNPVLERNHKEDSHEEGQRWRRASWNLRANYLRQYPRAFSLGSSPGFFMTARH